MRRFLICFVAGILSISTINAQTPQQLLEAAKKATKSDLKKENIASAQKAVDDALNASENQSSFEAYLYKGKLNIGLAKLDEAGRQLAQITQKQYKSEYPKSATDAASALLTALKNAKDPKATKEIVKVITEAAAYTNNYGSELSELKDYVGSYESFKAGLDIHDALKAAGQKGTLEKIEDYNRQLYLVGLLAGYADKTVEAKGIFEKMLATKVDSSFVYTSLYTLYKKDDPDKALSVLQEGRKKYPKESSLLFSEINYYLEKGKMEELLDKLKEGIEAEPNNLSLYFTLGSVYENLASKTTEEAKATEYTNEALNWYKKTLEKDPNNADALYAMGAYYYNKAAKFSQELKKVESDMSKAGQKKYDDLMKLMLAEFENALPFFQKSESQDPNNQNALIALKEIYARKNDLNLSKEFKNRLETVTGGGKNATPYFKN